MPTAGEVMDKVASLQNDTAKQVYTYVRMLPYLNMAVKELQEEFELNNVPVTNEISAIINIPANTIVVVRSPGGPPAYPIDLVEIQRLWQRQEGLDPFIPMAPRAEFLPQNIAGQTISQLGQWAWIDEEIRFLPANADNDIKIDYIKYLFTELTDEDDDIPITNTFTFLAYRTAGLCSEFIGENQARAESLNSMAILSMDRSLGISTKGRQSITTRRRPFMQSYRRRGVF